MPLPAPRKDEKQSEYMKRCMPVVTNEKDENGKKKHPLDQSIAICLAKFRNKK